MMDALNKLCKWRSVLTGWHLGTKAKNDPGVAAMRDLREAVLIHRVEITALTALLLERKVFTAEDLQKHIAIEAGFLDRELERKFPGYRTFMDGVTIYDADLARDTNKRLGFPP